MNSRIPFIAGIPFTVLLWCCLFLTGTQQVLAQAPFLAGTANKSTVGVGEQFQITFTFNGNGRSFQGPDLKDFNVLSGPNKSTNMQLINGNFSQSISFSYFLQPKAVGTFKIGPASIENEGKRIASNVIQITVVKGNPQAQPKGNGGQQGDQQLLSDKNIFARAVVNKQNVLKGESLIITYKLYANVNVLDFAVPKMPSFNGFWNQEIQLPQNLERNTEVIDGQRYTVWEIKKLVLFPQETGTLTIDPMELECIARVKVQSKRYNDPFSIFDDPFFGMGGVKDVKYAFKSQSLKVTVNALPSPAPADFGGAVGSLNFSATLDKTETKANEPVTLKIKINVNGNLKLADVVTPEFPPDLESYDPKINENFKASESGVNGSKVFEYLLIPRHEGEYEIPAIGFTYYDLSKRKYVSSVSGPYKLKVGKGNGSATASVTGGNAPKSDFQLIGSDIRYIKTNTPSFDANLGIRHGSPLFYTLSFLPFVLFGGMAGWVRYKNKQAGNVTAMRIRNATGVAKKRLAQARKLTEQQNDSKVYEEIHRALWGYLSDKFTLPTAELSKEKAGEVLRKHQVSDAVVQQFLKTIDDCEMARYGGAYMGIQVKSVYENAEKSITQIEEEVKA